MLGEFLFVLVVIEADEQQFIGQHATTCRYSRADCAACTVFSTHLTLNSVPAQTQIAFQAFHVDLARGHFRNICGIRAFYKDDASGIGKRPRWIVSQPEGL